jgi:hypothetical protein
VEDILAEQVGVTKVNNEIHIRGGRIDESLYIIDGLSIKDPLSGYSGNLFVNAESIEDLEIITGGYNAEYGQAMSGIINIRLKEGRDKFEGSIKYLSDHWGAATGAFEHFNSDRFEMNLGGPSPLLELMAPRLGLDLPGKFSFFANAYGKITDSHLPSAKQLYPHRNWIPPSGLSTQKSDEFLGKLAPRENNDWHALYKLSWHPDEMKKLSASYHQRIAPREDQLDSHSKSTELLRTHYWTIPDAGAQRCSRPPLERLPRAPRHRACQLHHPGQGRKCTHHVW